MSETFETGVLADAGCERRGSSPPSLERSSAAHLDDDLALGVADLHRRDRVGGLVERADVLDVRVQLPVGDQRGDDLEDAAGAIPLDHVAAQLADRPDRLR